MFNLTLLLIPLTGLIYSTSITYENKKFYNGIISPANVFLSFSDNSVVQLKERETQKAQEILENQETLDTQETQLKAKSSYNDNDKNKKLALQISVCALLIFLFVFAICDFSSNQFQFVQEYYEANVFNLYLGLDGLSMYFLLLTTIIMPISLLSN